MNLIDYTGKLNNHSEYLQILNRLKSKCQYVEYVLIDKDESSIIEKFKSDVLSVKAKNKWQGTKTSRSCEVYRIKVSNEFFNYLKKFETFCKHSNSNLGDIAKITDFGINDIAFFVDKELPLLFTTTHEGIIYVRTDLLI